MPSSVYLTITQFTWKVSGDGRNEQIDYILAHKNISRIELKPVGAVAERTRMSQCELTLKILKKIKEKKELPSQKT